MGLWSQIGLGLLLSAVIGLIAYWRGSLSLSGAVGAILVGTAIFGFGGWGWGITLIVFFVTSSLLSHYKETVKEKLAEKFDKGHQRDLGQALANGGAGAIVAVAYAFWPDPLLVAAFAGAMATVNADTWATELGVLNARLPRLITTGQEVEIGTSGGVSSRGTVSALLGASLIGATLAMYYGSGPLFAGATGSIWPLAIVVAAAMGGLAGSLFDSLLGATAQAIYFCPNCQKETERTTHTCGTPTALRRGWHWLNNDGVNFLSSLAGAGLSAAIWAVLNA